MPESSPLFILLCSGEHEKRSGGGEWLTRP